MPYVYSLTLEGGKKYVGYSNNLGNRLTQHFNGSGAQWTQKHSPISVDKIIYCPTAQYAKKLETKLYYNFKNYYGTERVRGAGYTKSY
jgi:predicted GIY-YIG superfamily endonuclease